jgi:hypothetical protein
MATAARRPRMTGGLCLLNESETGAKGRRNFWKITLGAARREDHDFYLMHAVQQQRRNASQEIQSSLVRWIARPAWIAGSGSPEA